jgi:hypothetical protein
MLAGGVVVDDEMDVELIRPIGFRCGVGSEELLMTMAGFALGDDRAAANLRDRALGRVS